MDLQGSETAGITFCFLVVLWNYMDLQGSETLLLSFNLPIFLWNHTDLQGSEMGSYETWSNLLFEEKQENQIYI